MFFFHKIQKGKSQTIMVPAEAAALAVASSPKESKTIFSSFGEIKFDFSLYSYFPQIIERTKVYKFTYHQDEPFSALQMVRS